MSTTIYVCTACGKTGPSPEAVGDESCRLHAVPVYANTIKRDATGRVVYAEAVPAERAEPPEAILVHTDEVDFDKYNGLTKR